MKSYDILLNAVEEGIEILKGWQEELVKQKEASMELEGLILSFIEAEEEAESAYIAEGERRLIQFNQK